MANQTALQAKLVTWKNHTSASSLVFAGIHFAGIAVIFPGNTSVYLSAPAELGLELMLNTVTRQKLRLLQQHHA